MVAIAPAPVSPRGSAPRLLLFLRRRGAFWELEDLVTASRDEAEGSEVSTAGMMFKSIAKECWEGKARLQAGCVVYRGQNHSLAMRIYAAIEPPVRLLNML